MSRCHKKIEGTCILLPSFINERLCLENCGNISNESNITNSNHPFLVLCNIHLELLNKNTGKVFRFQKRDPVDFFMIHNHGMEKFNIKYKTFDIEGNQNNSFRGTTHNEHKNRNKSMTTDTKLHFT